MPTKLKIIKREKGWFIKLPDKFKMDLETEECDEVIAKITPTGKLELSKPLGKISACQVCHKKPHRGYTCINCGKLCCAGCFWELGSLCHDCLGKQKK